MQSQGCAAVAGGQYAKWRIRNVSTSPWRRYRTRRRYVFFFGGEGNITVTLRYKETGGWKWL